MLDSEKPITFEQIPASFSKLFLKVERIEAMLEKLQKPTEETDPILTTEQAMVFLNLARPSMYFLVSQGKINSIKKGKKLYFLKSDLKKYLMSGRRKTKAEKQAETIDFLQSGKGTKA